MARAEQSQAHPFAAILGNDINIARNPARSIDSPTAARIAAVYQRRIPINRSKAERPLLPKAARRSKWIEKSLLRTFYNWHRAC
jgi:hypothetical protein